MIEKHFNYTFGPIGPGMLLPGGLSGPMKKKYYKI
jgi:hypothetical protein